MVRRKNREVYEGSEESVDPNSANNISQLFRSKTFLCELLKIHINLCGAT